MIFSSDYVGEMFNEVGDDSREKFFVLTLLFFAVGVLGESFT
jgi:hypothetical protein